MLQLIVVELRDVGVTVDTRFDAGKGEICVGFMSSTDASQCRVDVCQRVDAGSVNGEQYRVAEFRTPTRETIRLCTFLTATEVDIPLVRVFIEEEAQCWEPIDRNTNDERYRSGTRLAYSGVQSFPGW